MGSSALTMQFDIKLLKEGNMNVTPLPGKVPVDACVEEEEAEVVLPAKASMWRYMIQKTFPSAQTFQVCLVNIIMCKPSEVCRVNIITTTWQGTFTSNEINSISSFQTTSNIG